jgi:hypothetical protein
MLKNKIVLFSITFLLLTACIIPSSVATQVATQEVTQEINQGANQDANPTPVIVVSGSEGFSGQATPENSVLLNWKATSSAQKYYLDVRTSDTDFLQLAELSADQTSYEDIGVPEAFELTYRLRVQTASGTSAGDTVTITTPAATPNPLTVQTNDYAPIAWTPPTPDPSNPLADPSIYFPPGFDPEHPEDFDPASAMQQVQASADIGPEGGTVSVTTPDGITYDLIFPPDALTEKTSISLIPIKTIDGLPFTGGLQGAVRIEPDGLPLEVPATLRITRADATPLPERMVTLGFGFDGSGEEFHLLPFGPADQTGFTPGAARPAAAPMRAGPLADVLKLQELKGAGIGKGTREQAAKVVKKHTPTDAEARLLNELAYGEDNPELAPLVSRQRLATSKLLSLAQSEAPDWSQMSVTLSQLEILMKYYGKDPALKADLEKILNLLAERLSKMLEYNLEKCITSDDFYVQAVAWKIRGAKPGSMYDAIKKKLDPSLVKDVSEMKKACVLTLNITGDMTVEKSMVGKYVIEAAGHVDGLKFNFRNGKVFLTGQGTLAYSMLEITPERHPKDWCDPWIPDNVASVVGRVNVTRLDLAFAAVPNGVLQSVTLTKMTIKDSDAFRGKMTCYNIDDQGKTHVNSVKQVIPALGSVWYGYFVAAHMATPTYQFTNVYPADARPRNGSNHPIIADLQYKRPSFSPGYGTWSEDTKFELVDTRGK